MPGPDRADHEGHDGARAARTPRWPATRARSPSRRGRATRGPEDRRSAASTWILAANWVPYQLPTFVTPSFQGFASGHSTFSRAAAEVMTAFTGSEYFPGGISGYTIKAGSLKFETGPTAAIRLEWATYYDAADQAGQSRLYGGIHIQADDFNGRIIGSQCGKDALASRRAAVRRYGGHDPAGGLYAARPGADRVHRPARRARRRGRRHHRGGRRRVGRLRRPWGATPTAALGRPTSWTTRLGRVDLTYDGPDPSRSAAASPCSTATATAGRTCTSRAAPARPCSSGMTADGRRPHSLRSTIR